MNLRPGDYVRHRRRDEYGVFVSKTSDPETVIVKFDGGDEEKVSRSQLAKVTW